MNAQANERSENRAYEQAEAQANSIAAMVAALNVDYDRLEELRDELDSLESDVKESEEEYNEEEDKQKELYIWENIVLKARKELASWRAEYAEELKELEEAANGNDSEEEAREAIQNDALSVEVRKDWYAPGHEDDNPSEFQILLCTGGPAVRIMGELNDYCEPCRAWLEYQDWGTPWTHAVSVIDQDTLLQYCRQFWFGE